VAPGGEGGGMNATVLPHIYAGFGGAVEFIFHKQSSNVTGGAKVGGFDKTVELVWTQIYVSALALLLAMAIAIPVALYFGHRGKGELIAVGIGNAGRAVPELVVIALVATVIGVGVPTLTIALAVLGIPSILTNTFVRSTGP
jgi:osmoprotectant transport system permease protein